VRARIQTLALLTILTVACGIPIDAEPEILTIEIEDPPDIVEPTPEDLASVSLYLVREDELVLVTRNLPAPTDLSDVVESLLDGVTDPEARADLRTSIPAGTEVIGMEISGEVLTLDLDREFTAVGGEQEILAIAQIVLTATSVEGVGMVAFEIEGVPTAVPVASGALSETAVSSDDYSDLISS